MSYFAKIDKQTNEVLNVIRASRLHIYSLDDSEDWVQTSFNNSNGKKFAAIGDTYDRVNDIFYRPSPGEDYTLNTEGSLWENSAPPPSNTDTLYAWDETNKRWIPHYRAEDVEAGNVPQWYLDKVNGTIDMSDASIETLE